MATDNSQIPVVDIKDINSNTDLSQCPQVEEINSAFTSVGFVFIKNHGIDRKLVSGGGPIYSPNSHKLRWGNLECNIPE